MLENISAKFDDVLPFPDRSVARVPARETVRHIAVVGNYPPTKCGIATFTQDMVTSVAEAAPYAQIDIYAMVPDEACECPPDVKTIIPEGDRRAYRQAGIELDRSGAELVWLQHEFGLFGGEAGDWIIDMLRQVAVPLVVTLHTVLENPTAAQRRVMEWFADRASRIVVMSDEGRAILQRVYNIEPARIAIIAHGVPDRPFGRTAEMKECFGLSGRKVLMTFGLISPGKGIEMAIQALPAIREQHPDVLYCVVGATHPKLVAHEGEAYRERLQALASDLGVSEHIQWVNRYLDKDELLDRIEAADVYLTPYAAAEQSTSGTLSYAMALGKAIVSTPYKHARELLADDHGRLVPFADPLAMAQSVNELLGDPALLHRIQSRAYAAGRATVWPEFARQTLAICNSLRVVRRTASIPSTLSQQGLNRLCDSCGIIQHSVFSVPDRHHGYCVDDNARALMLAVQDKGGFAERANIFAAFVQHSWNPDRRQFRNFMSYDRRWLEDAGSTDSNGRTLWALGATIAFDRRGDLLEWAQNLWREAAPIALEMTSPRALAFAMLGADLVLQRHADDHLARAILAYGLEQLAGAYRNCSRPGWRWYENCLAYDNCRLPQAMLRAADRLRDDVAALHALESLDWIIHLQTEPAGHFRPVGSCAFGETHIPGDPYDQQPVDAWAMIDAGIAAYRYDGDDRWLAAARLAQAWFFGRNDRGLAVAIAQTGDCHDGLTPLGVNRNRGAESVLALHLGHLAMSNLALAETGQGSDRPTANGYQPLTA